MMLPLIWITGMDTGVVFCRRTDFEAVGGYNENLYYAEDVAFLYALKQLGKKTGQRLIRLSGVKALGSTRKFDEKGDWHYFPIMAKAFSLLLKNGMSVFLRQENLSDFTDYWYRPPR